MINVRRIQKVTRAALAALALTLMSVISLAQELRNPALNLSAAQKVQVDQIVKRYFAEEQRLNEAYPVKQGSLPSAEAAAARKQAREDFNAALSQVLTESQRATLEAARAALAPAPIGPAGPGEPRAPAPGGQRTGPQK